MNPGDDFLNLYNYVISNRNYLESQKQCLCHNDFQKSNIIKSSDNTYSIIDFEFVANNDPIPRWQYTSGYNKTQFL